ncbi:unnamed protein product [Adineta steineri]|uniref:Uncharacterized protein n=1 Tax=Adineta steineri TaxID=433720 RepID=A0A813RM72_9BILA|nr:unnamed protein product [Adineta steineri]CAF1413426.1 unnamed protein product [Adineta steineri]CAF1414016.1 unnamed protein product [Adineta steineri]
MSESIAFRPKNSASQTKLISQLERQFTTITQLLYTTSVPGALLDRQVLPYIADDIIFKDPWQEGGNKQLYRIGMKGFHNMFHFTFDTFQLNVKLNDDGMTGRCIVDGIMNLQQFSWIYTYPLRSIFVYEFRLINSQNIDEPQFEIFRHEEMWSFADMIDGIPGVGWLYKNLFRRGFGYFFVGLSAISCVVHDRPIRDIKHQLASFDIAFIDKSLSGACGHTDTCAKNLKILNKTNGMSPSFTQRKQFYEVYKNDSEMNQVNIFMCFHPVGMCELFMPFNRTMIIIASTRYELGRHEKEEWENLNNNLRIIASNPRNIIAGNNLYDAEYIRYFTGIKAIVLTSLCGYTRATYSRRKQKPFLIAPIRNEIFRTLFKSNLTNSLERLKVSINVKYLREVYKHYSYRQLVQHPAIIYVPYQVSTMSLFEQYRMNIPLFFPSLDLLTEWHYNYRVVGERTWSGTSGQFKNSSAISGVLSSDIPDPNNEFDRNAIRYWLQFADFYQWPHIIHFNSIDDLAIKLINTNLAEVSQNMKIYNGNLAKTLQNQWREIFERIK